VEEAIVTYCREESVRLAHAMPPKTSRWRRAGARHAPKDITLAQDETFTGGLCLVGMKPVSNYIVL
jgi:hypothetical protein